MEATQPLSHANARPFVAADVPQTLSSMKAELAQVQPLKEQLQRTLEHALAKATAESLQGCYLEVVGSSSWGGDIPESDLDLVLFTPDGCAVGSKAVDTLKALRSSLRG